MWTVLKGWDLNANFPLAPGIIGPITPRVENYSKNSNNCERWTIYPLVIFEHICRNFNKGYKIISRTSDKLSFWFRVDFSQFFLDFFIICNEFFFLLSRRERELRFEIFAVFWTILSCFSKCLRGQEWFSMFLPKRIL